MVECGVETIGVDPSQTLDACDGGTVRYRLSYTSQEQTEVDDLTNQFGLRSYQGKVNSASDEFDGGAASALAGRSARARFE